MGKNRLKTAFILNIVLAACVTFAIAWMMSGLNMGVFSASRLAVFKFFTVDSNILMGIAAIFTMSRKSGLLGSFDFMDLNHSNVHNL